MHTAPVFGFVHTPTLGDRPQWPEKEKVKQYNKEVSGYRWNNNLFLVAPPCSDFNFRHIYA
jgi:hypothetical protein